MAARKRRRTRRAVPAVEAMRPDLINTIPETILRNIVSRLSTKDAMTTSLVSPAWKYLWTSATHLDFDDAVFACYPANLPRMITDGDAQGHDLRFILFVDRALALHDSPVLKLFRIRFCFAGSHSAKVNEWVYYAMSRRVEELDLSLQFLECYALPRIFLEVAPETLKVLKLRNFVDYTRYGNTVFRMLRSLTLESVVFQGEELQSMLLHCPALHSLTLIKCLSAECLQIDAPNLREVTILGFGNSVLVNVRSPHVRMLHYAGWYTRFLLKTLSYPEKLVLDLDGYYTNPDNDVFMNKFIWTLYAARDITLSMIAAEVISSNLVRNHGCKMVNLKHLSLTRIKDTEVLFMDVYKKILGFFLLNCPSLESLTLSLDFDQDNPKHHHSLQEFALSSLYSSLSNLKKIEVLSFRNSDMIDRLLCQYDDVSRGWIRHG